MKLITCTGCLDTKQYFKSNLEVFSQEAVFFLGVDADQPGVTEMGTVPNGVVEILGCIHTHKLVAVEGKSYPIMRALANYEYQHT